MKKSAILIATLATSLLTSTAAHAQFLPTSRVYNYTTEISKIDSIPVDDRKHTIEIIPSTTQPHPIALIQWCNGVAAKSTIPSIRDRSGRSSSGPALGARSLSGNPADTKCYLTVPMNMGDSEFIVRLSDGTQTSNLEFRYRDIDPINSTRIFGQTTSTLPEAINVNLNESVHFRFGKSYGNLALEGDLPDGFETENYGGGITISGRATKAGAFAFTIHDLNSDNKTASHTLTVAPLPDDDDDDDNEKTACKTEMTAPASGERFVFRYPIKTAACS